MFDPDLVRDICGRLSAEHDPQRFDELLSTLRAVISSENEDARLRMEYIARHYPEVVADLQSEAA
jgi:hypothetical protein